MYYIFRYTNKSSRVYDYIKTDSINDIVENCLTLPINKQQLRSKRDVTKVEIHDGSTGAVVAYYKCRALPEPGTQYDDRYYFIDVWADERFDVEDVSIVFNSECQPVDISWRKAESEIRWASIKIQREHAQKKYTEAKEKYESLLRDEETMREAFEGTLNG